MIWDPIYSRLRWCFQYHWRVVVNTEDEITLSYFWCATSPRAVLMTCSCVDVGSVLKWLLLVFLISHSGGEMNCTLPKGTINIPSGGLPQTIGVQGMFSPDKPTIVVWRFVLMGTVPVVAVMHFMEGKKRSQALKFTNKTHKLGQTQCFLKLCPFIHLTVHASKELLQRWMHKWRTPAHIATGNLQYPPLPFPSPQTLPPRSLRNTYGIVGNSRLPRQLNLPLKT